MKDGKIFQDMTANTRRAQREHPENFEIRTVSQHDSLSQKNERESAPGCEAHKRRKSERGDSSLLIARTFLGPVPDGAVPYHKNGMQSENHINNIAYIPRQELGKLTGYSSRNKIVVKLDSCGQDVEYYRSAREAAKKNF